MLASVTVIFCSLFVSAGAAEPSKITLTVVGKIDSEKVRVKEDRDAKPKKDQPKKETVIKTLAIRISSNTPADPGPLKVKCSFLGRSMATKEKVVHKEITVDTKLEGREVTLKIEPVPFESAKAFTKEKGEKVEASGVDYRGFEILVYNAAGDVIGKGYSTPAIQEEAERAVAGK